MKRFFALLALVVLSLGLMGASAAAQENATANETTNETGPEMPPQVESILENVDPEDAPDSYVEIVRDWADGRLEDAGQSERERVESWLEDAEGQLGDRGESGNESDGDRGEDQLGNATDATATEVDTLENNESIRFSDSARLVGYEFENGRVRVAIETDITNTVTVSDALAGINEAGAVTVPKTTQDLESGTHIVTLPVQEVQQGYGAAVTVNGATVRLSSGMTGSGENPLQYFGGTSGVLGGIGLTIVMSGLAAVFVVWREESGVIEA